LITIFGFLFHGSKNARNDTYLLVMSPSWNFPARAEPNLPMMLFLISHEAQLIATTSDIVQMIFVLDDDLGLTRKVNLCIHVPPANSCKTLKTTIPMFRN
jgi:hypothetical protein